MNRLTKFSKSFRVEEDGGVSAEYALLAVLIAVVIIIAVIALGNKTLEPFLMLIERLGIS